MQPIMKLHYAGLKWHWHFRSIAVWAGCALLVSVFLDSAFAAGTQIVLRNVDPADGTALVVAADRSGDLFIVSSLAAQNATRVVKLDLNGTRLGFFDVPFLNY